MSGVHRAQAELDSLAVAAEVIGGSEGAKPQVSACLSCMVHGVEEYSVQRSSLLRLQGCMPHQHMLQ